MTHTIKAALAAAALAVANTACATDPAAHIERFEGTWTGTNPYGWQVGANVEGTDDNGRILGAGCWHSPTGLVRGARIDDAAEMSTSGKAITAKFGPASFTIVAISTGKLVLNETRPDSKGTRQTVKTTLEPTTEPTCAHRFPATAADIDIEAPSESLTGHWTGNWPTGHFAEFVVEAIDDENQATGRYCSRTKGAHIISVLDMREDSPLTRDYDPTMRSVTIERQATPTRRHRKRLTFIDAGTARFEATEDTGLESENTTTFEMRRGAHPEGCLRYTTALSEEG